MREKLLNQKWYVYVIGVLVVIFLGLAFQRLPYTEREIVNRLERGSDVTDSYIAFTPKEVVRNTAIGDVLHTDNRYLAIQSNNGKYWEMGEEYIYKITHVEEVMGVYILTIDIGPGDDR